MFCLRFQSPLTVTDVESSLSTNTSGVLPSARGLFLSSFCNVATFTCCTGESLSMAIQAATAADCPSIIKTGSIRIDPYAICEADKQTGTSRLLHSFALGIILLYAIGYGPNPPICTSPSFFTMPLTTTRSALWESIV